MNINIATLLCDCLHVASTLLFQCWHSGTLLLTWECLSADTQALECFRVWHSPYLESRYFGVLVVFSKYQSIGILVYFGSGGFYQGDLAFRRVSIKVWVQLYPKCSSICILSLRVWVHACA